MKKTLSYDDVLLVPQYSDIESRKEIDVGNDLDKLIRLDLPVISSPMDTVSEENMAVAMAKNGGLAIIHRYCTIQKQSKMVSNAVSAIHGDASPFDATVGAAVGMTGDFVERTDQLVDSGAEVICIDVAHGHHVLMERAIKTLRDKFSGAFHLMAGNVATAEGFLALCSWGADSVRCNIGGGSICTTRIQTGHGVPGFQTILDCAATGGSAKIIADGGMKNAGDVVKALAGSLFAGTNEAPGSTIVIDGIKFKEYRGMASKKAQSSWRGVSSHSEGVATKVPYKGAMSYVLKELREGIVSGFSYSGARNIEELWRKSEFCRQTLAGQQESNPHILTRL